MEKRENYIRLSLRDSETAAIKEAAKLAGEAPSIWVRQVALEKAKRIKASQPKAEKG